jgi:hypothetical protein
MNPFLLAPRERLKDWRALRQLLSVMTDDEKLAVVARYFAQAPLSRYVYDAHDANSWPTMWEMISDGDWCEHSVAIGMEGTLRLSGMAADRLKLILINDRDLSEVKFVVEIDGKTWLNYSYSIAVDIPETNRIVMCAWQFDGKKFVSVQG